ncbi:methyltransferase family protein [Verrucomicrobiota bacterium sgz303538]
MARGIPHHSHFCETLARFSLCSSRLNSCALNIFLNSLPLISIFAIYLARLIELRKKRATISGRIRENLTLRLFMFVGTATLFGSAAEYIFGNHKAIEWIPFIIGWCAALASFWIRKQAISALGRFWSLHIEIRDNHEFVQSGVFRFMRHPAYFSMILELAALALICHAWVTLIVVPVFFIPSLWLRIRLEEAALVEKFGEKYSAYQRSTPALMPALWKTK